MSIQEEEEVNAGLFNHRRCRCRLRHSRLRVQRPVLLMLMVLPLGLVVHAFSVNVAFTRTPTATSTTTAAAIKAPLLHEQRRLTPFLSGPVPCLLSSSFCATTTTSTTSRLFSESLSGSSSSSSSSSFLARESIIPTTTGTRTRPRRFFSSVLFARKRKGSRVMDDNDDDERDDDFFTNSDKKDNYDDDDEKEIDLDDDLFLLPGEDDDEEDDVEPEDVPDDWTEQDILAELGEDVSDVVDDVVDEGTVAVGASRTSASRGRGSSSSSSSGPRRRSVNGNNDDDDEDEDESVLFGVAPVVSAKQQQKRRQATTAPKMMPLKRGATGAIEEDLLLFDDDDDIVVVGADEDDNVDDDGALDLEDEDDDVDLDDVDLDLDEDEEEEEEIEEEEGSSIRRGSPYNSDSSVQIDVDDDVMWQDEEDALVVMATSTGGEVVVGGGGGVVFDEEWDEDEDGGIFDLQDDWDDPHYQRQKELVEEAIQAADRRALDEAFDPFDYLVNNSNNDNNDDNNNGLTPDQAKELDQLPFLQQVEEKARGMTLTVQDIETLELDQELDKVTTDLIDDEPYPRHDPGEVNLLQEDVGVTDDDMEALDKAYKEINRIIDEEPWDKVMVKEDMMMKQGWDSLPNQTLDEMALALEELGGSAYNVTRWLLYDLDFNVTNLMLAAVKHNPSAPILLQHWYPQLVTYERYRDSRNRNFDFSWQDVERADVSELERYYAGFGYDEIPRKAPAETGIIGFEDMDEEEIKMAAFENWMTQVYNAEWDRTDFDDDDMRDEDNVFSEFYDPPQHPDLPSLEDAEDDIDEWNADLEYENEEDQDSSVQAYRNMMGQKFEYDVVRDPEFEREFRGHLVVACTGDEHDLDVAEKITVRFEKEFGKKVFVETRVMALAREEDNVFEVWLESYEIDLLHSKKRATSNTQDWQGPAECDDAQIDYLVDQVRFLISDDARYSYRMDLEHVDA